MWAFIQDQVLGMKWLSTLIEKLHPENQVEEFIRNAKQIDLPQEELTINDRLKYAKDKVALSLLDISLTQYSICLFRTITLYRISVEEAKSCH